MSHVGDFDHHFQVFIGDYISKNMDGNLIPKRLESWFTWVMWKTNLGDVKSWFTWVMWKKIKHRTFTNPCWVDPVASIWYDWPQFLALQRRAADLRPGSECHGPPGTMPWRGDSFDILRMFSAVYDSVHTHCRYLNIFYFLIMLIQHNILTTYSLVVLCL